MGKLVIWNIMSLDGYFEGTEPWDLPTHELVWGPELEALSDEQLENAEALLFGRKTYEGMAAHWSKETGKIADGMNSLRKYVVSNSLREAAWHNSRLISGDAVAEIRKLKQHATKTIYVFGSAGLVATLLENGLVDEYRLCISPILLGDGNPLFKKARSRVSLKLLECTGLSNGGVLLKYAPAPKTQES